MSDATTARASSDEGVMVLPVFREDARFDVRRVETGVVRIEKTVETVPQAVEAVLRHEDAEIERVPVGRFVETAPGVREEDGVLIVPVVEEVLVTEKRLRLVEEIHVRRRVETEVFRETVEVRRENVRVVRE